MAPAGPDGRAHGLQGVVEHHGGLLRVMPLSGRKEPLPLPLTMPSPAAVSTEGSLVSSKRTSRLGVRSKPLTLAASSRQSTARRQNSARVISLP